MGLVYFQGKSTYHESIPFSSRIPGRPRIVLSRQPNTLHRNPCWMYARQIGLPGSILSLAAGQWPNRGGLVPLTTFWSNFKVD